MSFVSFCLSTSPWLPAIFYVLGCAGASVNSGLHNLLHKSGMDQTAAGIQSLRELSFSEYKTAVFTKYKPDARPNEKPARA